MTDLDKARADVTRSSGGGVAFLLAYCATLLVVGVLAFVLPVEAAALAFLFQGGVALPLAFALERRLGFPPMAADNPLRPLVIQLALTQVVALPAAIITYELDPAYVPAVFAAVAGGHFVPYAWLHQTRLYIVLGVTASVGPWLLMEGWGADAFSYVPLLLAGLYGGAAVALRTQRRRRNGRHRVNGDSPEPKPEAA